VRTEPIKRIGLPAPATSAPLVEDPEVLALRRARETLRAFADRAYRRPATAEELTRLVALVESSRKDGDGFEEAIHWSTLGPHPTIHHELCNLQCRRAS
jgi:hypothetical protein